MTLTKQTIEERIGEILAGVGHQTLADGNIENAVAYGIRDLSTLFIQMCEEILPEKTKVDEEYIKVIGNKKSFTYRDLDYQYTSSFNGAIDKMRAELEKLKGK